MFPLLILKIALCNCYKIRKAKEKLRGIITKDSKSQNMINKESLYRMLNLMMMDQILIKQQFKSNVLRKCFQE